MNKFTAKISNNKNIAKSLSNRQQGFTLIELLVVVSILAALAGITSVAMDGYQQDAEEKITRVEMQRIASAIRRFKVDTGYWPKTGLYDYRDRYKAVTSPANLQSYVENYYAHAADLSFLFYAPQRYVGGFAFDALPTAWDANTTAISTWDIEYAIGWHGPYVDFPAAREIVASTNCQANSNADMTTLLTEFTGFPSYLKKRSIGIVDRFERDWRRTAPNGHCVTTRDQDDSTKYVPDHISGSPYLYEVYPDPMPTGAATPAECAGTTQCIILRSLGKDSGIGEDDDDIIFVLHKA